MTSKKVRFNKNLKLIVFFLEEGVAGYVLPRFDNMIYIKIDKGDHFGHIDLVYDPEILNIQTNIKKNT